MADVANLLKRMQEVQLQYYQTLGRAAVDYWRSVFEIFGAAKTAAAPHPHGVAARPSPPPTMLSLVLEAAAGEPAESAFVVDNKLPQAVSATVAVSEFVGPDGRPVRVATTVSPPTVSLEPGAQQVVKITVAVTDELMHGVAYRAYAMVPGLSDGRIALVLRRRAVPDAGSAAP